MWSLSKIKEGFKDPELRWRAAAEASEYVYESPEDLWPIVLQHGSSDDEDMRQAIATNILEHVMEHHFDKYFPRLEIEVRRGNRELADTLRLSWKLGLAKEKKNSKRWDMLLDETETSE